MTVTEVRFHGSQNKNFLAYVSVVVGGCLVLRDMRLVASNREPGKKILIMPERKDAEGNCIEVYHPIRKELRSILEGAVFSAWQRQSAVSPANA